MTDRYYTSHSGSDRWGGLYYVMDRKTVAHCKSLGLAGSPCVKSFGYKTARAQAAAKRRAERLVAELNTNTEN